MYMVSGISGLNPFELQRGTSNPLGGINAGSYEKFGGSQGRIGGFEGTEIQKFKEDMKLGSHKGVEKAATNEFATNPSLYSRISGINGEFTPECRDAERGNELYLMA